MRSIDRKRLVNWGYLTSDLMLRTWIPELETSDPPTQLPYPEAPLSDAPGPRHWWVR